MAEIALILTAAWYVLEVVGNWLLFSKAGKSGWHSLIPILNVYDEFDICWKGSKGIFCLLIGGVFSAASGGEDIMFTVIAAVAGIWFLSLEFRESMRLARAFGKGTGYGLFLFIFDRLGRVVLGLSSAQYVGKP